MLADMDTTRSTGVVSVPDEASGDGSLRTFGDRLHYWRQRARLSGAQFGIGLGASNGKDASKQTIRDWEANRHLPNIAQLASICIKLNKSADYMLWGDGGFPQSEEFRAAHQAIERLTDAQRRALLDSIRQPPADDETVERKIPITKTLKRPRSAPE